MKKNMLFNKLNHKIIIVQDHNTNELIESVWKPFAITFAEIKPLFDRNTGSIENFNFGNIVTEGYFLFRIRFIKHINQKMRIQFRGRNFDIKRIIDKDESSRVLEIIALEI